MSLDKEMEISNPCSKFLVFNILLICFSITLFYESMRQIALLKGTVTGRLNY